MSPPASAPRLPRRCARFIVAAVFAVLALGQGAPAQAQSLPDLRAAAIDSLDAADPAQTIRLARALLARVPGDYEGLFLLSVGLNAQGAHRPAAEVAAQAFRAAGTNSERFEAARLAAGAHVQADQFLRAQWWLRIAANNTTSADQRTTLAGEFRSVQAENPLKGRLSFSVAPSDNINGGSEDASLILGDFELILPPESRALSGLEISGTADLSYRISQNVRQSTEIGLYLLHRDYILSDETRRAVPEARGSDFALSLAELSLRHSRYLHPRLGPTTATLSLGSIHYGGDPLWDYQRAVLRQELPLGARGWLTVQGAYQKHDSRSFRQTDARSTEVFVSYRHIRENTDEWELSVYTQSHEARSEIDSFDVLQVSARYDIATPVLGTRLSLGAGLGRTTYDVYPLSFDGRDDRHVSLSARAVLEQVSYFGFSPSVTVNSRRTESNIDRFTGSETQLRLGVESNF